MIGRQFLGTEVSQPDFLGMGMRRPLVKLAGTTLYRIHNNITLYYLTDEIKNEMNDVCNLLYCIRITLQYQYNIDMVGKQITLAVTSIHRMLG